MAIIEWFRRAAETNNNNVESAAPAAPLIASQGAPTRVIDTADLPNDTLFNEQNYLYGANGAGETVDVNIAPVWAMGYTGKGISIGVFDTAMDINHVDLAANIDLKKKIGNANPADVSEYGDEHATAVAGIIAGARNDTGVVGVAYDATLTPVNIFSDDPSFTWTALKKQGAFDIANHSWGFTNTFATYLNPLDKASDHYLAGFEAAAKSGRGGLGTLENVAAGNYREYGFSTQTNGLTIDRHAIVVGATDQFGDVSYYSNPGASLLIVAPSSGDTAGVTTSDVTGAFGYSDGDYTDEFGGTSAATPVVSGVEAVMLQANPNLGWRDVQTILAITARHTGTEVGDGYAGYESEGWQINDAGSWNGGGFHFSNDYGFGLIDAEGAVRLAKAWTLIFGQPKKSSNEVSASASLSGHWELDDSRITEITLEITSTITVEAMVLDLNDLLANSADDLIIDLISPDGTVSRLLNENGSDDAVIFDGWQLMSRAFLGESAVGTWTIRIETTDENALGYLNELKLTAYGSPENDQSVFFYTNEYGAFWSPERATLSYADGAATIVTAATAADFVMDLVTGQGSLDGHVLNVAADTRVQKFVLGSGDNRIGGGDYAIQVLADAGKDDLSGGKAGDIISGGAGDDMIEGGLGNDTLTGGEGVDTLTYANAAASVTVNLSAKTQKTGSTGTDTITGFENVEGSAFEDRLTGDKSNNSIDGNGGDDLLAGGLGNDTLIGGGGLDTASYAASKLAVTIDLGAGVASGGDAEGDMLISIENILGSNNDDKISGDGANNTLAGGKGDDTLFGANGDDTLIGGAGADALDGGAGSDTASYEGSSAAITIDLRDALIFGGDAKDDQYISIENVTGGNGNDYIAGDAVANTLSGGKGNDFLVGRGGADVIDGGAGNDTTSYAFSADAVSIDLLTGTGVGGDAEGDSLIAVENIFGSAYADQLIGDKAANKIEGEAGNDKIEGGEGDDILLGGEGTDTLSYTGAAAGVAVNLALTGQRTGGAGNDTIGGFENLIGSSFADVLTGDKAGNVLQGNDGGDLLAGGEGADEIDGGNGFDTASYAQSKVAVTIDLAAAIYTGGDADGDILRFIEGVIGSKSNDTLHGDNADNVIEGGAGADILVGGDGIDTLSYATSSSVTIDLSIGFAAGGHAKGDLFTSFENVTGGNGADRITGDAGNNTLFGANGSDVLAGGDGSDLLDGGKGIDTASFSSSIDGVFADLNAGVGFGGDAEGDQFISIENLIGSAGEDHFLGNDAANKIEGGHGDDVIEGRGGNDVLAGGAGVDTLSYENASAGVTVNLAMTGQRTGAAGNDTVSGFENIIGSEFGDILSGDKNANLIEGGKGGDALAGGLGCDVLVGGEGTDEFRFAKAAEGGDTIADFVSDEDTLVFSKSGFGISKSVVLDAGDEFDFAAHYFLSGDGVTATESHGQFLFDTASSQLLWDADGTGEGAAQLLAHFENGATPDAHDFILI